MVQLCNSSIDDENKTVTKLASDTGVRNVSQYLVDTRYRLYTVGHPCAIEHRNPSWPVNTDMTEAIGDLYADS